MKMRMSWISGIAAAAALGVTAAVPATSAGKPVAIEKELLGIRVLQSYKDVLLRYGAPARIFKANETVSYREAVSLTGEPTGGILGIEEGRSGGGALRGPGGPGGPGGSGGPIAPGGKFGGKGGDSEGGGFGPGASGGPAGSRGPGGGGGRSGGDSSFEEAGGFTWVYLVPFKELAYEFHFNKDGRVERIVELGRGFGQHTSRGIGLGDTIDKVYGIYGWTDRIKEEDTNKFSLLYNDKFHAQFLVLKNKVIGISVFLKESQFMKFDGSGGGGGGRASGFGGPRGAGGFGSSGGGRRKGGGGGEE